MFSFTAPAVNRKVRKTERSSQGSYYPKIMLKVSTYILWSNIYTESRLLSIVTINPLNPVRACTFCFLGHGSNDCFYRFSEI